MSFIIKTEMIKQTSDIIILRMISKIRQVKIFGLSKGSSVRAACLVFVMFLHDW